MSTTVELVRANERYARLRAAVEQLAAEFDKDARAAHGSAMGQDDVTWARMAGRGWACEHNAKRLRALLAAVDS